MRFDKIDESSEFPGSEEWFIFVGDVVIGKGKIKQVRRFPTEWYIEVSFDDNDIGTSIVDFLAERVRIKGGKWLLFTCHESELEEQKTFLSKNGFERYFVNIDSELDLEHFNMESLMVLKKPPIRIEKWLDSDIGGKFGPETTTMWQELYTVECITSDDIPGCFGFHHPDFEEFIDRFASEEASEDTIFVAIDENRIVGLTYAWIDDEKAGIYYTGVLEKYRGRGIGTALKITLAQFLKGKGYKKLTTNNRENNLPVLRTNQRMGFVPSSKTIFFRKKLE